MGWQERSALSGTRALLCAGLLTASAAMLPARQASATSITYSAVELDAAAHTWQYSYIVNGATFSPAAGPSGFDVYFDPALYSTLDPAPTPPSGDWFVFTVQPDQALAANGSYTAQALVNGASTADPFTVSFTFLGTGEPGSQPFDVFDPSFRVTETGRTIPASTGPVGVPEPASVLILGAAVLLVTRANQAARAAARPGAQRAAPL